MKRLIFIISITGCFAIILQNCKRDENKNMENPVEDFSLQNDSNSLDPDFHSSGLFFDKMSDRIVNNDPDNVYGDPVLSDEDYDDYIDSYLDSYLNSNLYPGYEESDDSDSDAYSNHDHSDFSSYNNHNQYDQDSNYNDYSDSGDYNDYYDYDYSNDLLLASSINYYDPYYYINGHTPHLRPPKNRPDQSHKP